MTPGKPFAPPRRVQFLAHFGFWFTVACATPGFIAFHNVAEIELAPWSVLLSGFLLALFLGVLVTGLINRFRPALGHPVAAVVLAATIVLVIQGNVLYGLHDFGVFDGRPIDFDDPGGLVWIDAVASLTGFALLSWLFRRREPLPTSITLLPLASSLFLIGPVVFSPPQEGLETRPALPVDESVYAFSSMANLIHLLPDGFQGDTVQRVFEQRPELASRFEGFTLFTDHVGRYPGTAPSLYTMLTGEAFPLDRGFSYSWVGTETQQKSYQATLARAGYQVDLVPISAYICPDEANSCHSRPFNNSGLRGSGSETDSRPIRLLADLTLFRLLPLVLKEQVYDEGYWLLSEIWNADDSPVPDPVLREWTARLQVIPSHPVYKWYHYVGTHVPPRWDEGCDLKRGLDHSPENYGRQAECILEGIAKLIDALKGAGIYEKTSFIISGDHGHNTVPMDQAGHPFNYSMYDPLLGTGRPALMVKPAGAKGPLTFDARPTELLDITPTALALAGLPHERPTVFGAPAVSEQARLFHHYPISSFWTGEPVPYLSYEVGQPSNDASQWRIEDIVETGPVPSEYVPVNKSTAKGFVYGAHLRSSIGETDSSWIRGRQLAFVIDLDDRANQQKLLVELSFEEWMEDQSVRFEVNGHPVLEQVTLGSHLDPDSNHTLEITVPPHFNREGPDFVTLQFDRLFKKPGASSEYASARIVSIRTR